MRDYKATPHVSDDKLQKKKSHICVTVASKILKYVLSFEMLLEGKCRLIKNFIPIILH